jgi:hypothetical protein
MVGDSYVTGMRKVGPEAQSRDALLVGPERRSRVRVTTPPTTTLFSRRNGGVGVEPRGKLRKRREYYADNYMELVKTEWCNARVY